MIFLSQIKLDPFNPSVRQALKNHQDMHRNIMKAFQGNRKDCEVLFRLVEKKDRYELIVLSKQEPQWELVQSNGYICMKSNNYSDIIEKFKEGAIFRFDLMAVASKKVKVDGSKNSKRVFYKTVEEREKWLELQGHKYGFELLEMYEKRSDIVCSVQKKEGAFQIHGTEFVGTLKIVDRELFSKSWPSGFGAEKAYGMGLMLLSRT